MEEHIGKIYKIIDSETGIILDELGRFHYYTKTSLLESIDFKIGDDVIFTSSKKVLGGYTLFVVTSIKNLKTYSI